MQDIRRPPSYLGVDGLRFCSGRLVELRFRRTGCFFRLHPHHSRWLSWRAASGVESVVASGWILTRMQLRSSSGRVLMHLLHVVGDNAHRLKHPMLGSTHLILSYLPCDTDQLHPAMPANVPFVAQKESDVELTISPHPP